MVAVVDAGSFGPGNAAGFHEYVDTEQMFYRIFTDLRRRRVIP